MRGRGGALLAALAAAGVLAGTAGWHDIVPAAPVDAAQRAADTPTATPRGGPAAPRGAAAPAFSSSFTNSSGITIPSGAPATTQGTAAPYPSTINVSGLNGNLTGLTVTVTGFTHACPRDVDLLLVGPGGQQSYLYGQTGDCEGTDGGPVTLTFDDAAATIIGDNGGPLPSGVYKPSAPFGTTGSGLPSAPPNPGPSYNVPLAIFNGTNPNGTWSLYVNDCCQLQTGAVASWTLNVTVPDATPTSTATATATTTSTPTATTTATVTPTATATPPPAAVSGNLRLLPNPVRVVDTRPGLRVGFKPGGAAIDPGPLPTDSTTRFQVAGQTFGGVAVPADITGVLVNVTIVQPGPSGGFVTLWPGDGSPPLASTVNPGLGTNANFAVSGLSTGGGTAGSVAITSVGGTRDVLIDLVGYYSPTAPAATGNLRLVSPVRVLDTRSTAGGPIGFNPDGSAIGAAPLAPNAPRRFQLAGKTFGGSGVGGVGSAVTFPADVTGVVAHVTTVQGGGTGGFVTLLPGDSPSAATGGPAPGTSTVNPATAIAFNGTAIGIPVGGPAGVPGTFALYSTNALDAVVDIVGYYSPSNALGQSGVVGNPILVNPLRVVDTRSSGASGSPSTPIGFDAAGAPISAGQIQPGQTRTYSLAGKTFPGGTLPADARGVLLNVTLAQGAPGGGFVTVFPGDAGSAPNASTVNPSTAIAASFWANALSGTAPAGTLNVFSSSDPRDVIVDVVGYFR